LALPGIFFCQVFGQITYAQTVDLCRQLALHIRNGENVLAAENAGGAWWQVARTVCGRYGTITADIFISQRIGQGCQRVLWTDGKPEFQQPQGLYMVTAAWWPIAWRAYGNISAAGCQCIPGTAEYFSQQANPCAETLDIEIGE